MSRFTAARFVRMLAIVVALHGLLFAIAAAILSRADNPVPESLGQAYFFVLSAPALILAMPFSPLLWHWHLMETPGWFAWPKPAGFLLVYVTWVVALLVLARRMLRPR